jgi:hypothetical protein
MRRTPPTPDAIIPSQRWSKFAAFGDYLGHNKLAMVFIFVLLLTMIVMDTSVTAFGYDFGFKSSTPTECIINKEPAVNNPEK